MYLRTTKRKNKDGSVISYYHLAHNVRHPETHVSTPKLLYNFGRADLLDRDQLVRLCRSIAKVCGLEVHDPLLEEQGSSLQEGGLPKDLELLGSVELGTPFLLEAMWEQLGVGSALRQVFESEGRTAPYERALFAMTANRLCEPLSKLGVWQRWLKKVYLPSCWELKLEQLYEAMDLFHKHSESVEKAVFYEVADLLNLEVDVVFYDTSTVSFSIDDSDELDENDSSHVLLRNLGRSKEGVWTPQVVVALAVTKEGIPIRSWVFSGNTSDVTTIEKIKKDLQGWKLGRALFIGDSGFNSEESRKTLARACGKYLLATRMSSVKEVKEGVLSKRGRYTVLAENLHAKEVVVGGDGVEARRYILCYNPKQAERQRQHRERVVQELEQKMEEHKNKKATAQWAIELKASGRYGRYLKVTKGGQLRINRGAIREAGRYDGKWVVQTNDDTLSLANAAQSYKALLVIERCFRSLKKTQIQISPVFHWTPRRIETHIKICVLSLLMERVAELKCAKPWAQIRELLLSLQATHFRTKDFYFYQRNEPASEVKNIFEDLGVTLPQRVLEVSEQS
jgi:transposase